MKSWNQTKVKEEERTELQRKANNLQNILLLSNHFMLSTQNCYGPKWKGTLFIASTEARDSSSKHRCAYRNANSSFFI